MKTVVALACFQLVGAFAECAVPTSDLYPFRNSDLQRIRVVTKAESSAGTAELNEAWDLYGELKGSWMPGARKPLEKTVSHLDRLKAKLEEIPRPQWFVDTANPSQPKDVLLADKVGDDLFEIQRATSDYQTQKALAIVYLTEHELDRPNSANDAGRLFSILTITHPWDWEAHALFSRLLIDAGQFEAGWHSAIQSIYLNPEPNLEDLKFFAFVGRTTGKGRWSDVQEVIREAAPSRDVAEHAIRDSISLFSDQTKTTIVPAKK